jgi:membrane fusion protein (multidrug efflux system)
MKKNILLFTFLFRPLPMMIIFVFSSCGGVGTAPQTKLKTYTVTKLSPRKVVVDADYPASILGIQNIEIRPKIDGYVENIYVDEGASVKRGQLLFRISAPQYEQNVNTAAANIKIAVADVNAAKMQVDQVRPIVAQDIVSPYELKSAQYSLEAKEAALAQAKAEFNNAKTNLGYTTIYSPSDGVIGVLPYKIGSLITSTTTNPLTTVSNIKKIYAYFSISERQALDFFQAAKGGTLQQKLKTLPPVILVLANGTQLANKGYVDTETGLINAETGAVNMRATFTNPDGLVRSGSSAIVRVPATIDNALLIPQKSTYQIQDKTFVYVIDADNKVRSQELIIRANEGQFYVISKGLKTGQQIVLDGIASLREGMQISPKLISADAVYLNP